ncbi:CamS family sex pheromone protein [Priestia megaterium]|uniref:CamS family sex pheromone protein n=1 Tax=Priestia megaterium TaxID=1404 RepID=UPI00300166D6
MKKILLLSLAVMLVTSACAPNLSDDKETVQQTNNKKEKAVIPKYSISDDYYRTILPFKAGVARGLVAANLNNRLDAQEFETGLMRLSTDSYSPKKYVYQEGQYLDKDTIRSWLSRKLSDKQFKDLQSKAKDDTAKKKLKNNGLNPIDTEKGDLKTRNETSPMYLANITEQDYLIQDGDDKVKLGGVTIGLAMNSVHYYTEENGYAREKQLTDKNIEEQGKKMADEIVQRMRNIKGLENVPIRVALFKQSAKASLTPGNFMAVGNAGSNDTVVGSWDNLDEKYYLFPSSDATKDHRDDAMKFDEFKAQIEDYFPNFTSVVGKGYYKDGQLQKMTIDIPVQFYGKGEIVGFTQYVAGLMLDHFPSYMETSISINSVSGPEALIVRKADEDKPFVHIYEE